MPGAYRYSATFDRTYEESESNPVRFSIQSWQGSTGEEEEEEQQKNGRHVRSASTDSLASGGSGGSGSGGHSRQVSMEGALGNQEAAHVPTRSIAKQVASPLRNPLQFVKVGPVPLYKKAEEQIKLLKEVKQTKEKVKEDEEWQMNLDSWKSRRKKVSEKTIQRLEESAGGGVEEYHAPGSQRKIKTFSEMLEQRSQKPRAYNLAIYKEDSDNNLYEENKTNGHLDKNVAQDLNADLDESVKLSNGDHDDDDACVGDSGLESFGSSQRTYDIPDSSSEISAGSSDRLCPEDDATSSDGITTGMDLLAEYSSPSSFSSRDLNNSHETNVTSAVDEKSLQRFFKSSQTTEPNNVEQFNGSPARDCHSRNEKPKKTPPPVPAKPKLLLKVLSRAADPLPTSSDLVISKTVKPVNTTDDSFLKEQTLGSKPIPKNAENSRASSNATEQTLTSESSRRRSSTEQLKSPIDVSSAADLPTEPVAIKSTVPSVRQSDASSAPRRVNDEEHYSQTVSTVVGSEVISEPECSRETVSKERLSHVGKELLLLENNEPDSRVQSSRAETLVFKDTPVPTQRNEVLSEIPFRKVAETPVAKDDAISTHRNEVPSEVPCPRVMEKPIVEDSAVSKQRDRVHSEVPARKTTPMQYVEIPPEQVLDKDTAIVEEPIVKVKAKVEQKSVPTHFCPLTPVVQDDGLTVIYKSHPSPSKEEPDLVIRPASLDKVGLNNIIDELEDAIKSEMESEDATEEESSPVVNTKVKEELKKVEVDALYNLTLDLYTDEQLLANLEAPPSQIEPPKERPPPPPPPAAVSSSPEKESPISAANGVQRMSTFKRMKKEMWRRRSDFLGIDPSQDAVDVDAVPPPPDIQEMLKSERDIERQWMEQNRPLMVPSAEEEIVQKEREIIENLEREERERQEGEKDEQELMADQGKESGSVKQEDEERIQRLKDERRRMEEERFQREEQRMRLEEERLMREREEHMRKQEECVADRTLSPGQLEDACHQEALRIERERLLQEKEAFLREKEEYNRKMEEQRRAEINIAQKLVTQPLDSLPAREAVICASKCPQGFNNEIPNGKFSPPASYPTRKENGGTAYEKPRMQADSSANQQPQSVIMRNRLQSLGAPPKAKYVDNEQWISEQRQKAAKRRSDPTLSRYNQNHWLIQEAEMRRLAEQSERQRGPVAVPNYLHSVNAKVPPPPPPKPPPHIPQGYPVEQQWNYRTTAPIPWKDPKADPRKFDMVPATGVRHSKTTSEPQDHFLSVSGKEKCSHCGQHLGRGEAMIIESLQLCYHIQCFCCCVCQAQLGNGSCGTDVRVRNNKLHCQNCYSNDEAGLKFSQV